jgi:hypothetical protein
MSDDGLTPAADPRRYCKRCREAEPAEGFYKKAGLMCRPCHITNVTARRAHRRVAFNAVEKARYQRDPAIRRRKQARVYGLTPDQYEALFIRQAGVCAICRCPERIKTASLCIDHDHKSGLVRGLLCRRCNAAIGLMGEDRTTLLRALAYLRGAHVL